jgi:VanZ family protein
MLGQRTLARPVALLFTALVVYASLYPFEGWRWQGGQPFEFLMAPLPPYWTAFDVFANLLGYVPLGFLTVVVAVRSGVAKGWLVAAFLMPSLLSLALETIQTFLPSRVASNLDWFLNSVGGLVGSVSALLLARTGFFSTWQRFRRHWFEPEAHGALLLLALWPVALLYPVSLPFGLGQVWWGVESSVADMLADTTLSHWLPVRQPDVSPLSPVAQAWCMALCLLAPCLLGYTVLRRGWRRVVWLLVVQMVAVMVAGLSSALTYGPAHAWSWLTPPVWLALATSTVAGGLSVRLSRKACVVWLVWVLLAALTLLNQAPLTPYLAESLSVWAQGRFIRFHGLTQWLGWLWPYAVMLHAAAQVSRRRAAYPGLADTQ